MVRDLLYPDSSTIAKFNSRFSGIIKSIFLLSLLSAYPFVITHLAWDPFEDVNEISEELNFNPSLSSQGNSTTFISYNESLFDFEVVAQRVWNGSGYDKLTVPLFFSNDELNLPRNITFIYYWIVQENLTIQGDSDDIRFYIPSFGSRATIVTESYPECGSSIDIYILLNTNDNEFFVGSLQNTVSCWG
ncbi:MAG: hypothetical protein GPJ54_22305 [Candidatus Heimdallarchaeota archaeon]|nr:hypothetical protein [Candidatus Heimdallarchaeota archaeon]